jgi:hypothetical protein
MYKNVSSFMKKHNVILRFYSLADGEDSDELSYSEKERELNAIIFKYKKSPSIVDRGSLCEKLEQELDDLSALLYLPGSQNSRKALIRKHKYYYAIYKKAINSEPIDQASHPRKPATYPTPLAHLDECYNKWGPAYVPKRYRQPTSKKDEITTSPFGDEREELNEMDIEHHHKKVIDDLTDLTVEGQYMSLKLNNLLLNATLQSKYNKHVRSFLLLEVIYENLWDYRLSTNFPPPLVIDSEGFQHDGDGCYYHEYTRLLRKEKGRYKEVSFPWPQLELEANAKTKGWIWFDGLPKGVLPYRFIFKVQVCEGGATSGWVQDEETIEFVFADEVVVKSFASNSKIIVK